MDYSALARSYDTLSYVTQLRELLAAFFKNDRFLKMNKLELATIINETLFRNYGGEEILKFKLANEFIRKDFIAAFEVKALNSRTDFLAINGDTKSFEIKSSIDTLNRLNKQIEDYGNVFEFNTIVLDKCHLAKAQEILPDFYGIWYFEGQKKVVFKSAKCSPKINPEAQLKLFNKKELKTAFDTNDTGRILYENSGSAINYELKKALKQRYASRWKFIVENWQDILPIDIQFFFNTNIKPEIIYG